ncbi:MAG: hypothetical protein ATN35_00985 [Epulopiscium sp. Nele67-Bin004]|nr:MAG: hypothetical protein ATN35_00985 [Epulopiscium sp. Nele67-Bin004]
MVSIAIVGGDLRFVRLAQILVNQGFNTLVYALEHPDLPEEVTVAQSLKDVAKCKYVVGPIPFSRDGNNLFTPLSKESVSITSFLDSMYSSILCLSALNTKVVDELNKRELKYIDMIEMDEVAILNAINIKTRSILGKKKARLCCVHQV